MLRICQGYFTHDLESEKAPPSHSLGCVGPLLCSICCFFSNPLLSFSVKLSAL
jgi:hypothetical protein